MTRIIEHACMELFDEEGILHLMSNRQQASLEVGKLIARMICDQIVESGGDAKSCASGLACEALNMIMQRYGVEEANKLLDAMEEYLHYQHKEEQN
jgi:hypothetical protein